MRQIEEIEHRMDEPDNPYPQYSQYIDLGAESQLRSSQPSLAQLKKKI